MTPATETVASVSARASTRMTAKDFPQEVLNLYDDLVHGRIARRDFLTKASLFAVSGMTAEVMLESLAPNYALADQVAKDDKRIKTEKLAYESPQGTGKMSGLLAYPAEPAGPFPAVLVVHENRGLNPYIEDVVRRLAVEGFLAFGPDALTSLGGYPGNDEEGRNMQAKLDGGKITEDFIAAAKVLDSHKLSTGKVGVVGFCFGGGMANTLAVRIPEVIDAAVPYYGRQPNSEDVSKIDAPLLIHYAELDERINAGWPKYEEALKANDVKYEQYMYPKVNHGFHNDTTPRYDEAAAKLSWDRTIAFFKKNLKG
jgi:Dienelactone hydrolase and related enzymes